MNFPQPLHRAAQPLRTLARDWRITVALGATGGLALGLAGLLGLQGHGWLPLWGLALLGLTWLGWDVEPRLPEALVPKAAPRPRGPKRVQDGPLEMVELPGGSYQMGSPDSDDRAYGDEKPQHQVQVSGFRLARTTVTTGLWHQIMGGRDQPADPSLPVADISWTQAVRFCNRLSRRQGYKPCYRLTGVWPRRRWVCNWRASGYRLPSEAEWEYACRAGSATRYSFGDDPALLGEYAWFNANSGGTSHPVATRKPNRWGLFDMHGNLWEWCWDWYGDYAAELQTDTHGPKTVRRRVLRGGSFVNSPVFLRSANRDWDESVYRNQLIGFRCARSSPPSVDSLNT